MATNCLQCGTPLIPRPNDGPKKTQARKYCSYRCKDQAAISTVPARACQQCGTPLMRRTSPNGRRESVNMYLRRNYCSAACSGKASRKPTGSKSSIYRESARYRKDHCELCGANGRLLDIHHKDRNPLNNDPSNLITLCKPCHTTWHMHGYAILDGRQHQESSTIGNRPGRYPSASIIVPGNSGPSATP